ncbi:hypothetical protein B0H14DRAFT_3428873 [Mycena olivaceomarginata]|nr:hypothetical protein B0H14DRAFT_3428873 [Mycena olivaceomarginata]
MSRSSTPSSVLSLFTKRRRAFLACTECRKRKIKVSIPHLPDPSVNQIYLIASVCFGAGYRFVQTMHTVHAKGHQMRILCRPGQLSSFLAAQNASAWACAGKLKSRRRITTRILAARISGLTFQARRRRAAAVYQSPHLRLLHATRTGAGTTVAESRSRPSSRAPTPSATNFAPHQPSPRLSLLSTPLRDFTALQTPTAANPQPELDFADMFTLPQPSSAPSTQQPFASLPTPIAAYPIPKYDSDDMVNRIHPLIFGGTYDLNNSCLQSDQRHSQVYAPPAEPSGIWPEPILCICPPGPCYCGANFNDGGE